MLIGETTMIGAWKTLNTLYGNKTLIANKLKSKLKNLKSFGKEDHEAVIAIAIEVKSIVARLKELNLQDMLKYDDEYLAAIFRAFPGQERMEWLKFSKASFSCQWDAMMLFLDDGFYYLTQIFDLNFSKKVLDNKGFLLKFLKINFSIKINRFSRISLGFFFFWQALFFL